MALTLGASTGFSASKDESEIRPTRVACVGDSITYGFGIQKRAQYSYPAQLQKLLGDNYAVANFGKNGATVLRKGHAPYWKAKQYQEALDFEPDVVVIKLGTNDSRPENIGKHKAEFVADYVDLIRSFQSLESRPEVWICYPAPIYSERKGMTEAVVKNEIAPLVREVASKAEVDLIDLYSALRDKEEMFPDGLHPNSKGAGLIANSVADSIKRQTLGHQVKPGTIDESPSPASLSQTGPNILLIYVDDMGYGDLGCYGSETKSPRIDQLAKEGIRFTNYLSASSVCSPSRAAILTGRYPNRNGLPVCPNGSPRDPDWNEHVGLPLSEITIAELLRPKGYGTAAFGKWHLGEPEYFGPRKQGFDEYVGSLYNFPVGKPNVWLHNEEPQGKIMFAEAHQKLTDATIKFMKEQQAEKMPFFIYLAHYLVHGPWSPNKEFCTDAEWASYQKNKGKMNPVVLPAMVRELDHHVGLVLDALDEMGLEKDTLVIFASDNGPWLPAGSAKPLSEGKYSSKEGGHRVPAMIRWPGKIPAGQVSDEMVSALDLLPTIAAASGTELPDDRKYDGFDLMPLLSGKSEESPRTEFAYYNGLTLEAVRRGHWKLHLPRKAANLVYWAKNKGEYTNLNHVVLNNLYDDLAEKKDLSKTSPEKTEALEKLADETRMELGDWNVKGSDQAESSYPGNLNTPNWKKAPRRK